MLADEKKMEKVQSETISLLRFPMALLVVLIHTDSYYATWKQNIDLLSGEGVCFLVGHVLRLFAGIAVPTFFLISGFLFFWNFREFTWDGYKKKMKSRFHTLIIPYLLWNVLVWAALLAAEIAKMYYLGASWNLVVNYLQENSWHFLWDLKHWGDVDYPWLWWTTYLTGPIDRPLWFLRDLIVVTVLSPLIYWTMRKLKVFAVLLLFAAYVTDFWVTWHGFKVTSFFYYGVGAYLAINGKNMVEFFSNCRVAIIAAMTVFLVLTITPWIPFDYKSIVKNLFNISAVSASIYVASCLVFRKGLKANPLLTSSCFFIYACHDAALPFGPVISIRTMLRAAIPGDTYWERFFCYLAVPCITAAMLVFAYLIIMRRFSKIAKMLCGGR